MNKLVKGIVENNAEIIGYVGLIVIVIAYLHDGSALRIYSIFGSLLLFIYSLLIKSYPFAALQVLAIVANLLKVIS